jgi:hypothetical protein
MNPANSGDSSPSRVSARQAERRAVLAAALKLSHKIGKRVANITAMLSPDRLQKKHKVDRAGKRRSRRKRSGKIDDLEYSEVQRKRASSCAAKLRSYGCSSYDDEIEACGSSGNSGNEDTDDSEGEACSDSATDEGEGEEEAEVDSNNEQDPANQDAAVFCREYDARTQFEICAVCAVEEQPRKMHKFSDVEKFTHFMTECGMKAQYQVQLQQLQANPDSFNAGYLVALQAELTECGTLVGVDGICNSCFKIMKTTRRKVKVTDVPLKVKDYLLLFVCFYC